MSDRSFRRWQKFPFIAKWMLSYFDQCLAQGDETAKRLRFLGAPFVQPMNNLKFSVDRLPVDTSIHGPLKVFLEGKKVWMAASTHEGEEEIIFDAVQSLYGKLPSLFTVLAPRHPHRSKDLQELSKTYGFSFMLLSDYLENPSSDMKYDGLIIDRIGCLGTFFDLSAVVVMGGSLKPFGGHNPIEPALFGKPVICGPYMENFREVIALMKESGLIILDNAADISLSVEDLLNDSEKSNAIGLSLADGIAGLKKGQRSLIESLGSRVIT
jgi:3-deoxy-D-manno-octulosonic-acid transferase